MSYSKKSKLKTSVMKMQQIFKFIISLAVLTTPCVAYKYTMDVTGDTMKLLLPCEGMPNVTLYNLLDLEKLNFSRSENGTIHIYGTTTIIADLPQEIIKAKMTTYKLRNGKWSPTYYNMNTLDLCTKIFSPKEIWSSLLEKTPPEQKQCPLRRGQEILFDLYNDNMVFDIPDRNLEGRYKIEIRAESTITKQVGCTILLIDVYQA